MRSRQRRRLDKVLIAVGGLVVGGAGLAGSIGGDQERINAMWVGLEVDPSGGAEITEVIDYDFGGLATDKHGIYRDVPGLDTTAPITVRSATAPDDVLLQDMTFTTRIRIGDANQTIGGRHRYEIDYPLDGLAENQRLNWNAVGTDWEVGIDDVEVHIVTPWVIPDPLCSSGDFNTVGGCEAQQVEPGRLVVEVGHLDAGDGITVSGEPGQTLDAAPTLPTPPADRPADDGSGLAKPAALAAALALLGAAPASVLARRAGREQHGGGGAADLAFGPPPTSGDDSTPAPFELIDEADLEDLATTDFAPPAELTPAQGGIILDERVTNDHKVAWLIQQAIDGAIDLEDDDPKKAKLHWKGGTGGDDDAILVKMFNNRQTVTLGKYDKRFAGAWGDLDGHLEAWRTQSGYWDPAGERRRDRAIGFGVLAGLVGLAGTALGAVLVAKGSTIGWLVLALGTITAGAGIAAAIRAWELRVRTMRGTGLWLRVESFRRFIAESEAFHADWAAEHGILREYTAWAVAVGEIDRWSRSVAASSAAESADAGGYRLATTAMVLNSATTSAATAPSSSGGGGGFSGGVGGGGGGGGGGSW